MSVPCASLHPLCSLRKHEVVENPSFISHLAIKELISDLGSEPWLEQLKMGGTLPAVGEDTGLNQITHVKAQPCLKCSRFLTIPHSPLQPWQYRIKRLLIEGPQGSWEV